jgi:glycerol kinase
MEIILAIDQGTTNTKAIAVKRDGAIVAQASQRTPLTFPRPGWAESDPHAVWESSASAARRCLELVPNPRVISIGVSNQRESVIAWERRMGQPLGPCISWQCRRTTDMCEALRARGVEAVVQARSGLSIDPMFSATKARWLIESIDDGEARARRGEICIGTVDTWLAWNLTAGEAFVTDHTNASRTQLFDLDELAWSDELLEIFGIPAQALPAIGPSSHLVGHARGLGWLPEGTPIHALIGDSHAALFGHGAPPVGTVKATYGTGTSVMAPVPRRVRVNGLSSTIAWSTQTGNDRESVIHAVEGNIPATGAAIEWMATMLGLDAPERVGELAATVTGTDGAVLIPAFAGLGAPHWDPRARALIAGVTRGTTRGHLARAALECVAYQVRDVVEPLAGLGEPIVEIYADGGAIQSDLLAQIQADILGVPVLRNTAPTLAAIGAAYLAGVATGTWPDLIDVRALPRQVERFQPTDTTLRGAGYEAWKAGLRRASSALDS